MGFEVKSRSDLGAIWCNSALPEVDKKFAAPMIADTHRSPTMEGPLYHCGIPKNLIHISESEAGGDFR